MLRVLALVGGLLVASTASFAADWTRVQSAHFRLMGDASEADIKTVAVRLEQFRDTFGVIYPTLAEDENAPPMIVFVFKNKKTWEPFRPRFNGKAVDLDGYFQSGRDVNYIALTADAAAAALPVIFHEYTHLLVHRVAPALPPWLDEGLADYYSTFDVAGNARQATYGKPIARHISLLRERFVPLPELFAVTHDSPLYNEGDKRSIFYAESWALVHYALVGRPALGPKLLEFAGRVTSGAPIDAAFKQAMGMEMSQLERELREYVRLATFQYQFTTFSERLITKIDTKASRVSEPETEAWLGDLLGHMNRTEEAIQLLNKAIAADSKQGMAHASLGMIYVRQRNWDAAIAELRRAVDLTSDSEFVHYFYGVGLLQRRASLRDTSNPADLQDAEAAFVRALELRPGFGDAMTQLGYTRLFMGKVEEAREPLQRAWAVDPANYFAALALAQVHLRTGAVSEARDLLGRIVALGTPPLKEQARVLLSESVRIEQQELRRQAGLPPGVGTDGAAPTAPAAANAPTNSAPPPPVPSAPRATAGGPPAFVPAFRRMKTGEERSYGLLERVECTPTGIVLHLRAIGSVIKARAKRFDDVDLITYRQTQQPSNINCGLRPAPEGVYLTWHHGTAADGVTAGEPIAVALELLPEGFVPRPGQ